ncbi:MAG: FixH family protein [Phycisphaerales bacterium]
MTDHASATSAPSRNRAWLWPLAVVGMLAISMSVCAITVVAAVSDPSYAIEDDYYQKAVDWDQSRELERASAKLGWRAEPRVLTGNETLSIVLRDADGEPIADASVRALAFHHARRGDARALRLISQGDGLYTAPLTNARAGQWQVRIRAVRGRDQYVSTQDVFSRVDAP